MIRRATEICVFGRYVPQRPTEFHHAANDARRALSETFGDNDNPIFGRIA